MVHPSARVTALLKCWNRGESAVLDELMALVFDDLRRMASRQLAGDAARPLLQTTALVNEVLLKLLGRRSLQWKNTAQFFAVVAGEMRRILVDQARRRKAGKRHGERCPTVLDEALNVAAVRHLDLVALDDALKALEQVDSSASEIVELRFFVGLSYDEIAEVLGISKMTARRRWETARIWLFSQLAAEEPGVSVSAGSPADGERLERQV